MAVTAIGIDDLEPMEAVTESTRFEARGDVADPYGRLCRKATGAQLEAFLHRAGGSADVRFSAEATARESADTALQTGIDAEATARETADTALQTAINAEAAARETADTALQTSIDAEATARASADTALQTGIDAEATARETADTALQTGIDDEATARASADTALQTAIDDEATARQNADIAEAETRFNDDMLLQEHIDYEATARSQADAELQVDITAEATARSQADTALNERLSAVESEKENITNKVNVSSEATEAHYPNAKSVYEYGQSIIESLSGGLKTPLSYSLESDVPTTIADLAIGAYFVVEDMNITKPGHSGRIWVNELVYFENDCTLTAGGADYTPGDILHGGSGGIHIVIDTVDANGVIQTWRYEERADFSYQYTYTDASGAAVPFTGGTGSGAAFDIVSTEQPKAKFFFRVIDQYMHPDGISIIFTPAGALEIATDWLKQWAETQNIFLNNIPASGEAETGKRFNGKPIYAQRFAGTYTGTSGANTTITLLTWGNNSPNRMMSATGWCIVNQQSGNTTIYPLGCFVNSAQAYVCQKVETGALEFVIRPSSAITNGEYDFWVEYTKG